MKRIKLIIALALLAAVFASPARADVVIYRVKQTGKLIGGSNEFNLRGTGFVILDPDTKQGYTLSAATVLGMKILNTTTFTNTRMYTLTGAKGKTYTAFASSALSAERDRNQFARGLNAPLAIKPDRTISFPKVIAGSAGTVIQNAILIEGKATATFSLPDTRAANASAETVDQVYQRLRDALIAQGYEAFDL